MPPVIKAVQEDITRLRVDAIVNAANHLLVPGGGVDGAIHRAAGPDLERACRDIGGCGPGEARATPAFRLPARWVIHTVGPVWRGGRADEEQTLESCYRRAIEVAEGLGAQSVAFPAISTGAYGFPRARAASIAVSSLRSIDSRTVRCVVLVAYDNETHARYQRLLAGG